MSSEGYKENIARYIKKNLSKGYTLDSLKWALINQGYPRASIDLAIKQVHKDLAEKAPVLKEKPVIKYEIYDKDDNPIKIKKKFWKKFF